MPTLLFVCTANLCRSPMAEALFADWLKRNVVPGEWQVGSAGIWAADGQPASEGAAAVMAERGLDLSRHHSRQVTEMLLAAADLILCMTRSHREALQVEFPAEAHKIRLLSEMVGQTHDVEDPYGGSPTDYARAAEELAGWMEAGGAKIVEVARRAQT